ncbi:hypothetical protein EU244_025230 [Rhodococcus qingshengii]|uniref:helix-turn-helix domain-containing protein n=1 Tax=Rhodococcus qingshengii TaxID=334542 RepID=UPI0010A61309|nr:helix-turn-helix transcriptional regulator [Rhodococcus qingshengii]THJ70691.1 helix-turn-helix transcriptional regulator [Rhodococcus qingshengii]
MSESRWWMYLKKLMGNDNAQTAAQKAGISSSNFSRWKKGANADPEFVVKIARAYRANVLEALVEAEFITEDEAHLTEVDPNSHESLMRADDEDLMEEVLRRMQGGSQIYDESNIKYEPLPGMEDVNVFRLTDSNQSSGVDDDFSGPDLHLRSVADKSPREDGHGGDESAWDA